MKIALFLMLLGSVARGSVQAASIPPEQQETMEWFQDAKFGLFIHWGVYSMYEGHYKGQVTPRYAEWVASNARIPIAEYRKMGADFNPVKYDPAAWAELAREGGMQYVVITTKHHDGYALFDSKVSDWSVMNSTYGKDLIGPLAKACKKEGLRFGAYYSQSLDWVNGGQPRKNHWDQKSLPDYSFDDYLKNISLPQVEELLESYPEIDIMWWDMPKEMTPERTAPFNKLLAKYPRVIQNPRMGKGGHSNFYTFEQNIPPLPRTDRVWESCMTMNHTWGYRRGDESWKSTGTLIRNLVGVVSKGGNYLLNIGPKPDGTIPEESIVRIKQIGSWLKENGEAIYGTTYTPFDFQQPWKGACTRKTDAEGSTLYLHVFDWPANGILPVLGLESEVAEARMLVSGEKLEYTRTDKGIELKVPVENPGKYSTTVVLRVPGELKIKKVSGLLGSNGARFSAADAEGGPGSVKFSEYQNMATNWKAPQSMRWKFDVVEPGQYWIRTITCAPHEARLSISCDGQSIRAILPDTGDWKPFDKIFEEHIVGTLELSEGACELVLAPTDPADWLELNLHAVELVPVEIPTQDGAGSIHLPLYAAQFGGEQLVQAWNGVRNWTSPKESLSWGLMITRQGDTFDVVAEYACEDEVQLTFLVNGEAHAMVLPATKGETRFLRRNIGKLPVTASGKNHIELRASAPLRLADLKLWNQQALAEAKDAVDSFPLARANHYLKSRGVAADTYHPKRLLDGDPATYLSPDFSKKDQPLTIEVDLGSLQPVTGLKVFSGDDALDLLTFRARVDGEMKTLVSGGGKPGWTELSCEPVQARLVQLEVQNNHAWFKLFEMHVVTKAEKEH